MRGDNDAGDDVEDVLESIVAEERERLEQRLERAEARIDDRREVYQHEVDQLQQQISDRESDIKQILSRPFGGNVERRETLEEEVEQLRSDLNTVRRKFWQDIQRLEEEKRDILEQLDELDVEDDWSELL